MMLFSALLVAVFAYCCGAQDATPRTDSSPSLMSGTSISSAAPVPAPLNAVNAARMMGAFRPAPGAPQLSEYFSRAEWAALHPTSLDVYHGTAHSTQVADAVYQTAYNDYVAAGEKPAKAAKLARKQYEMALLHDVRGVTDSTRLAAVRAQVPATLESLQLDLDGKKALLGDGKFVMADRFTGADRIRWWDRFVPGRVATKQAAQQAGALYRQAIIQGTEFPLVRSAVEHPNSFYAAAKTSPVDELKRTLMKLDPEQRARAVRDIVRVQMADIGSAYTTAIGDSAHKALGLTSEMNKEFLMAGRYRDMMSTGRLSTSSFLPHLGKMGVMETIAKEVGVDASLLPKTLSEGWANTPERLKAFQAQLAGFKAADPIKLQAEVKEAARYKALTKGMSGDKAVAAWNAYKSGQLPASQVAQLDNAATAAWQSWTAQENAANALAETNKATRATIGAMAGGQLDDKAIETATKALVQRVDAGRAVASRLDAPVTAPLRSRQMSTLTGQMQGLGYDLAHTADSSLALADDAATPLRNAAATRLRQQRARDQVMREALKSGLTQSQAEARKMAMAVRQGAITRSDYRAWRLAQQLGTDPAAVAKLGLAPGMNLVDATKVQQLAAVRDAAPLAHPLAQQRNIRDAARTAAVIRDAGAVDAAAARTAAFVEAGGDDAVRAIARELKTQGPRGTMVQRARSALASGAMRVAGTTAKYYNGFIAKENTVARSMRSVDSVIRAGAQQVAAARASVSQHFAKPGTIANELRNGFRQGFSQPFRAALSPNSVSHAVHDAAAASRARSLALSSARGVGRTAGVSAQVLRGVGRVALPAVAAITAVHTAAEAHRDAYLLRDQLRDKGQVNGQLVKNLLAAPTDLFLGRGTTEKAVGGVIKTLGCFKDGSAALNCGATAVKGVGKAIAWTGSAIVKAGGCAFEPSKCGAAVASSAKRLAASATDWGRGIVQSHRERQERAAREERECAINPTACAQRKARESANISRGVKEFTHRQLTDKLKLSQSTADNVVSAAATVYRTASSAKTAVMGWIGLGDKNK